MKAILAAILSVGCGFACKGEDKKAPAEPEYVSPNEHDGATKRLEDVTVEDLLAPDTYADTLAEVDELGAQVSRLLMDFSSASDAADKRRLRHALRKKVLELHAMEDRLEEFRPTPAAVKKATEDLRAAWDRRFSLEEALDQEGLTDSQRQKLDTDLTSAIRDFVKATSQMRAALEKFPPRASQP